MRLFHPYPKDVIRSLVDDGVRRIYAIPLAQHSAPVYGAAMTAAAREVDASIEVVNAPNWGQTPELTHAFADAVLAALPASGDASLILTAHSLPTMIIQGGDPYEAEMRASAEAVVAEVRARGGKLADHSVAFQSQGIGTGHGVARPGPRVDARAFVEIRREEGCRRANRLFGRPCRNPL